MLLNKIVLVVLIVIGCFSCEKNPEITDGMLDGKVLVDAAVLLPDSFLISKKYPSPTAVQLATPVIIASHGYTAGTFEWQEFVDWVKTENKNALVSQVLLGAHGQDYETFRASTWKDWQSSIVEEYNALKALGYSNISFVGSSTSCPLFLELLSRNTFAANSFNQVFLIDPIVVSSNKTLSLSKLVGPLVGYIDTEQDSTEDKYWYHYRPQETLVELNDLINTVRKELQKGINLPDTNCNVLVYKTLRDNAADPISAVLIQQGINQKNQLDVKMLDSDLHVFTRLSLRPSVSNQDKEFQLSAFETMVNKVQ